MIPLNDIHEVNCSKSPRKSIVRTEKKIAETKNLVFYFPVPNTVRHLFSVNVLHNPPRSTKQPTNEKLSGRSDGTLASKLVREALVGKTDLLVVGSLLDNLITLGDDDLDVARVGHVRVDL